MKQESRGKLTKLKGSVKEAAGILTGNREMERQGAQQRAVGVVQERIGEARRKAGDFANEIGKAIKKG
jgi:uncharacterized protein YjbJ (UPF0337 family)